MEKIIALLLMLALSASIGGLILMLAWNLIIIGLIFTSGPTISFIQAALLYLVLKILF